MLKIQRYSTFKNLHDNRPKTHLGWDAFVKKLSPPLVVAKKSDAPLYCPAVFIEGGTRTIDQLLYISFGVIDIDKATEEQVSALVEELTDLNISFVYHTSFRYSEFLTQGLNKCRLLFPFSRPVDPDEWDRVWFQLNDLCHGLGDTACRNPNAIYYFPSHPPGAHGEVAVNDGDPLDVDWLLSECPANIGKTDSVFQAPSEELLARVETSTRYILAKALLHNFPRAVEGEGGDRQTLKAAFVGHDFGLTEEEFWPLLLEYNQIKCTPLWGKADLEQKLSNAYKYPKKPFGWRLVGQGQADNITAEDLDAIVKKDHKSKNRRTAAQGRLLRTMLSGEVVADADPVAAFTAIAKTLAYNFPYADPRQLVAHFEKCIAATAVNNRDITADMFVERIKASQEEIRIRHSAANQASQEYDITSIQLAFSKIAEERSTPYTTSEIAKFAEKYPNLAHFNRHWILRKGKSFYLWLYDRYLGPYMAEEAMNAAHLVLSPAQLDLHEDTPQGRKPIGLQALIDRYGTMADKVVADMTIQKSYFDPQSSTFYEATCPMRDIEPVYSEQVNTWLEKLCDDDAVCSKLLDWLACLPIVELPTAALFIYGERATGKSLLAHAVSRLWTENGCTELDDVAGAFNSKLAECPIVFGDEGPPKDNRGDPKTTLLRRIIQEHSRTFRRKHLPDATLKGSMRVILAANSLDVLISATQNLNNYDIEAINERFLLVPVNSKKAKAFLESLTEADKLAITHGLAIASHTMWLYQNRAVNKGHRLLVEGVSGSELEMRMTTSTGLRGDICQWVASYIMHPERVVSQGRSPVIAKGLDGRNNLLLSSSILNQHWSAYLTDQQRPKITQISGALAGVNTGRQKHQGDQYRIVNMDYVRSWCVSNGFCGEENFDAALSKLYLGRIQVVGE